MLEAGIILVNKPQMITSHDIVIQTRRVLKIEKAGHVGTLDPMATGVLPICVGRATKIAEFLQVERKQYRVSMQLGIVTDTQDITGKRIALNLGRIPLPRDAQIREVIAEFVGEIEQIPPMYSALKIGGKKLYELARKGIEVERKPRKIRIHSIEVLKIANDLIEMLVDCSKGTYMRTLCHDIGNRLGCGGCMSALIRTRVGRFALEQCITTNQLENKEFEMISIDGALADFAEFIVPEEKEFTIINGGKIEADLPDGFYRVKSAGGELLAISRAEGGVLKLVKALWV
ncbi:MAG: tRNA pseudouridine(55) synthase TruB [Clostridiales bacterium]|nr:tRNA pseudouridine(55) synthase TruB [Clostridiales bacterium]